MQITDIGLIIVGIIFFLMPIIFALSMIFPKSASNSMFKEYPWYRKLRGGYWVYWRFIGWYKVDKSKFEKIAIDRNYRMNGLEDYTK